MSSLGASRDEHSEISCLTLVVDCATPGIGMVKAFGSNPGCNMLQLLLDDPHF